MNFNKRTVVLILPGIVVGLIAGYFTGYYSKPVLYNPVTAQGELEITAKDRQNTQEIGDVNFKLYWQVWDLLQGGYYKQPINDIDLFYSSLKGLVAGLGDPYSTFFDPPDATEFNDELSGNFKGIGAEIGIKNKQLTVVAPLNNSPAKKAGLQAGDAILAIDSIDTSFMTIDYAVSKIRGEEGTEVILTVLSKGAMPSDIRDVSIIRGVIHVESVSTELLNNGIYVLTISNFNEDTHLLVGKAVTDILTNSKVKGIVLDMRNNPGGFLDTAVKVAGYWTGDRTVVIEKFSDGTENQYEAGLDPVLANFPTAVLINGGSASASEIVAGALRDYELATLIGETTFGKGTVQTLESLPDGSSLKYTVAEWLTPLHGSIDVVGIDPGIQVELNEEDYNNDIDPQLDAAIQLLLQS